MLFSFLLPPKLGWAAYGRLDLPGWLDSSHYFLGALAWILFYFFIFCSWFPPPLFKVKHRKAASDPPALKLHRSEVPIGEEGPEMSCNGRKKRARERKWGVSEGDFWEWIWLPTKFRPTNDGWDWSCRTASVRVTHKSDAPVEKLKPNPPLASDANGVARGQWILTLQPYDCHHGIKTVLHTQHEFTKSQCAAKSWQLDNSFFCVKRRDD